MKDVKEMSNADVIAALCYLMLVNTPEAKTAKYKACEELEYRGVIDSADKLYKTLDIDKEYKIFEG